MKKILPLLLIISFVACNSVNDTHSKNNTEILFQVKNQKDFEDEIMPWILIKNPENFLEDLIGKEEIVIKENVAILIIDYPLSKPINIEIESSNSRGFSKDELVKIISREYKRIYKEEEESSAKNKVVPKDARKGLINRNTTNGKYGIWGHDIDDLDLSAVIIRYKEGKVFLELIVES